MKLISKLFIGLFLIIITVSCGSQKIKFNSVKTEMFFGLSTKDSLISEKQWLEFKSNYIDNTFSGYTEIKCEGYWTNQSNTVFSEKCKMIIHLNSGSKEDVEKIKNIITNYKKKFNQESVLIINNNVNAKF